MCLQALIAAILFLAPKDLAERGAQRGLFPLRTASSAGVCICTRTHGRVTQGTGSVGAPLRQAGGRRLCAAHVKLGFYCAPRCHLRSRTRNPPNFRRRGRGAFRHGGKVYTFVTQGRGQSNARLAHGELVVVGRVGNRNRAGDDLSADTGTAGSGLTSGRGGLEDANLHSVAPVEGRRRAALPWVGGFGEWGSNGRASGGEVLDMRAGGQQRSIIKQRSRGLGEGLSLSYGRTSVVERGRGWPASSHMACHTGGKGRAAFFQLCESSVVGLLYA
jgi:hypothetical protein